MIDNNHYNTFHVGTMKLFLKYSLLTVCWLMIGSFIFLYLEACSKEATDVYDTKKQTLLKHYEKLCIEILKSKTVHSDTALVNCTKLLYEDSNEKFDEPVCELTWTKLSKWIQFCGVTITTIGYGTLTPKTDAAKLFLIIFASFGIPITLQTYTIAGRLLSQKILKFLKWFEKTVFKRNEIKYQELKVLLLSIFFFILLLNFAGFYATLKHFHGLTFIDGIYFWFVSLTTIGYGDITTPPERYAKMPYMIIIDDVFTIFGLGMMAATVDSFIVFFSWLPENSWRKPLKILLQKLKKSNKTRKISSKPQEVTTGEPEEASETKIYSRMESQTDVKDLRNMVI